MKKVIALMLFSIVSAVKAETIETDVKVEAASPWGKVWVTYKLSADLENVVGGCIVVSNRTTGVVYESNEKVILPSTKGQHSLVWDIKYQGLIFDRDDFDVWIEWLKRTTIECNGHKGVQLWEDGPYWAECNIGAEKPEDDGWYFWWGDTVGCKWGNDRWVRLDGLNNDYSFSSSSCPTYEKDNTWLRNNGWIDASGNLTVEHDAAARYWGGNWRMPTKDEIEGFVNNCTRTWTTRNGTAGYLVTGKGEYSTKSIFIPAAGDGDRRYLNHSGSNGFYWSSTPSSGNSRYACNLYFGSGYFYPDYTYGYGRNYGFAVRPVAGFTK